MTWEDTLMQPPEPSVPMRDLIAAFSSAAKTALVARGWKKRSGDIFTLELGNGFVAWLGLNRGTRYHPLTVNPVVGVIYEPARKLERQLKNLPPAMFPAVAEPVLHLASSADHFLRVADPADAEREVAALVELLDTYGLPFARALATPEAIVAALRDRRHLVVREYGITRLPAMLASLGMRTEARDAMATGLDELGERTDPAAEAIRRFAVALSAHLDA